MTKPNLIIQVPFQLMNAYMNKIALSTLNKLDINKSILAQASIDYVTNGLSRIGTTETIGYSCEVGSSNSTTMVVKDFIIFRDDVSKVVEQRDAIKYHLIEKSIFGQYQFIRADVLTIATDWVYAVSHDIHRSLKDCFDERMYYFVVGINDHFISIGVTNDQSTLTQWVDNINSPEF